MCVCISIIEGANLFTLGESWRVQGAGKKQKLVSISSQYWERRFHTQGILDIRTHFKPTETFQYTHFSHKGLIKGKALRLLRTNSSAKSFYENIYNFKKRLRARRHPHKLIEKTPLRLNLSNRSQFCKRTMKCERKFCLSLPRATLLCRTLKTF